MDHRNWRNKNNIKKWRSQHKSNTREEAHLCLHYKNQSADRELETLSRERLLSKAKKGMDTSGEHEKTPRGSTDDPDDPGEFVWYHDLVWMRQPGGASAEGAAGSPKQSSSKQKERVVCVKLSNGQQVKFGIQSGEQLKQVIDSLERAI